MRAECRKGYDPYNSMSTRLWRVKTPGAFYEWDDNMQFMSPKKRGASFDIGWNQVPPSTYPRDARQWPTVDVANMNDPASGFAR